MREYFGPDDHRFCVKPVNPEERHPHEPNKDPSKKELALEGHEVLACAHPENYSYPERNTTYNQVEDSEGPNAIYTSRRY